MNKLRVISTSNQFTLKGRKKQKGPHCIVRMDDHSVCIQMQYGSFWENVH